ncbi:hypothetical protein IV203_025733 [Nitzschia inconspicua]|uniref:Uncharacterized protein n=1 Tax=Nitzschia inconspicua TaxID=303405 RepID=A0A9K3PW83_9STRA|nr:hypothetical protein IV203_025733 [Nitzschia inconspicua]
MDRPTSRQPRRHRSLGVSAPLMNSVSWKDLDWEDINWELTDIYVDALTNNQTDTVSVQEAFLSLLRPEHFTVDVLGDANFLHSTILGSKGVEDLLLDNRHIHRTLKEFLCLKEEDFFRDYFETLINMAWPDTTRLLVCCSQETGKDTTETCDKPDYVFGSRAKQVNGESVSPLTLAPHFLTSAFEDRQQEMLTAAFIASTLSFNGESVAVGLSGIWDLGPAGTRFVPRDMPDVYTHELGAAWGNMFLDCASRDKDHFMCQDAIEQFDVDGLDPMHHGVPMFTCSDSKVDGTSSLEGWGNSCFTQDSESTDDNGCGFVRAVGRCSEVCFLGHCGMSRPPREGRVLENVIQVYLSSHDWEKQYQPQLLQGEEPPNPKTANLSYIGAISVVVLSLFVIIGFLIEKKFHKPPSKPKPEPIDDPEKMTSTDNSDNSKIVMEAMQQSVTENLDYTDDFFTYMPTSVKDIIMTSDR